MSAKKPLEPFMLPERIERLEQAASFRTRNLVVVLDGVHDAHNYSAVVRSVDAFGLLDLHVIETQGKFKVAHKVSQGCHKWLDIHRHSAPDSCMEELNSEGFEIWVADCCHDSLSVEDLPWERRLALVFGNEHEGPSETSCRSAKGSFHIPMFGFAQSFNISVAAGITLSVAIRNRQARLGSHGDLSLAQQQNLILEWQRRSVRAGDQILEHLKTDSPSPEPQESQ